MNFFSYIIPLLILAITAYALAKRVAVFPALIKGAGEGLGVIKGIFPSLVGLFCAVYMLRASGALDVISYALSPALSLLGIPKECAPLLLLRPVTGSGAIAAGSEIMGSAGVDSIAGRTAAVMVSASETTFYTIAVYFGAAGVSRVRYAAAAAILSELCAFVCAAFFVRLFFG